MTNLRQLWPYLVRYRMTLLAGLCCAAGGAAVSAVGPYVLGRAVDTLLQGGLAGRTLLFYGGLLVLVAVVEGLFRFGQRVLIGGTSHRVDFDLRAALFERLMRLDQSFYGTMHTGDLMARATNDLGAVRQFLGPGVSSTATAVLTLLAVMVLMFVVNVTLTLSVLLLLPMVTLFFVLVGRRMRRVFAQVQDQFGDLSTRAQENLSGIRTIKAYAREEAEVRSFAEANDRYRQLNLQYVLLSGALWPGITLIMGGIAALVLLVGGRFVIQGTMTLGELVQFQAYLALLAWPMIALGWMLNLSQQATASLERLHEVLHCRPAITTASDALAGVTLRGDLQFRDVGIRFARSEALDGSAVPRSANGPDLDAAWLLRHVSFHVPAGTSLAIVGPTGAGKTTLVSLLGRVRDPDEGQVLIDGIDLRQLRLDRLRQSMSFVLQDSFLFSMSLRENVTYGLPVEAQPVDDALVLRAAESACLSNDLPQFPHGLDTLVGERGVTLSGGQKQRVALARAIMRDPTILVLDDALSSVDMHTAAEILSRLRRVMRGRTSIIIAQRIATVKDADQIMVLDHGQIAEQGAHHELLQRGGIYAAMYRRELLEAELGD